MKFFTQIPEAQAILRQSGVYRQVDLYARDGLVYAKYGAGYVRLAQGGSTSHPKINWLETDSPVGKITEGRGDVRWAEK